MATNDETHRILGRIESELSQIKSSVSNLQRDMSEIAGGLAVVLNRSDENKTEIGILKTELEASKKKHQTFKIKSNGLSNISLPDLQKTRIVLQQWRAQHLSRRM